MNLTAILFPLLKHVSLTYFILSIITSCHTGTKKKNSTSGTEIKHYKEFSVLSPEDDEVFTLGDTVLFTLNSPKGILPDSVKVYLDGNLIYTEKKSTDEFTVKEVFLKVGRQNFRTMVYYFDSLNQTINKRVTVLSDLEPENLTYWLIRKFHHGQDDFTQGLIYYNDWLYEGTGRLNFSKLKRLDPESGKTVFERQLDNPIFGEGITIINNKVYQLTYRNKIGFIYNVENFELIREFDLQTREGWGLTTDGNELIVSDGSSVLYFYDPEYLNQTSQLEVANNRGLVTNLNELEYVNGTIWANVYGESYIVQIDTGSGKVLAYLELESLFPAGLPRDYDHVLNGIAYDYKNKTFFVTGKHWPLMYEIEIIQSR